jgi:hypothetical protein
MIWSEVAWMSAWNCEPMMPIFTLSLLAIGGPSFGIQEERRCGTHYILRTWGAAVLRPYKFGSSSSAALELGYFQDD